MATAMANVTASAMVNAMTNVTANFAGIAGSVEIFGVSRYVSVPLGAAANTEPLVR